MADRVNLRLKGLMCEKLMCRAMENGAELYDISRISPREVSLCAPPKSAKIILKLSKRYSFDCRVSGVRGRSAVIARMKKRLTLPLAFIAFGAVVYLFTSRVWSVKIIPIDGEIPESVYAALEGITPGGSIDTEYLSLMLKSLDGIAYASCELRGAELIVKIACEKSAPEIFDISIPRDIVASRDCVIYEIDVRAGDAVVKIGDTVKKGDILIAGRENITKDETRAVGALGVVRARMWFEGACEGKNYITEKDYTGRKSTGAAVKLFGMEYEIARADEYENEDTSVRSIPIGGAFLPLYIERRENTEYIERRVQSDAAYAETVSRAEKIAMDELSAAKLSNAEIVNKWVRVENIDTLSHRARFYIEVIADAGEYPEGY